MDCKIAEPQQSVEELVAMYQKKQLGLKQTVGVAGYSGDLHVALRDACISFADPRTLA